MHALVNKLTLGKPIDSALLQKIEHGLGPLMSGKPGFVEMRLIEVSDTEAIIVAVYTTREALDELSRDVAAPWFAEHVRPYLGGPAQRSVGKVVASVTERAS
jgi:hypothetical protein